MEAAGTQSGEPRGPQLPGIKSHRTGQPYAGGVRASASVGETADRNVPKRTTWEEDIRGSRNEQGMVPSVPPPFYALCMCQQRRMMTAKMSRAR